MTNIFNALENCLQEIEKGTDIESVLKQYPEFADELRPILKTALKAQRIQTTEPAPEAFWRGRAKVLQHAAELRTSQPIKRKSFMPVFSRLAISFALAFVFLLSGAGLLSASASALPGEGLYTVKRGWESVRLFLIFDQEARELLKNEFENERLHEVSELLSQGKNAEIQFAGIFMQVNGMNYVSGVPVVFAANTKLPLVGEAVIISGHTNLQGFVEVFSFEILPNGTFVPLGNPIQIEIQTTPGTEIVYFEIQGILQMISTSSVVVNNQTLYFEDAQIIGQLCLGQNIKVNGYYASDGRFVVIEIVAADSCSDSAVTPLPASNNNTNSNTNENSNSNDDSNEDNDDDTNDDNEVDDNSGSNDDIDEEEDESNDNDDD